MIKKIVCYGVFLIGNFFSFLACAGINQDLNDYFNKLGFSSNITSASAYHGQSAGYYSGGSVFTRNAVRDVQIIQVDLPSYRSGCGGIDLYAGGFSFINSDQLVSTLKNILNNAAAYSFTLAMETVTPEIANVMKYWYDIANVVNQSNVNSCEAAETLVGGLWPKNRAAQARICEDVGTGTGLFTDWAAARQGCGTGGKFTESMSRGKQNPHYKNMIIDSGNIVWKATQQIGFLKSDPELAELFMSLSGTVVLYKNGSGDNANIVHQQYPAIVENNDILTALLYGSKAKIYQCDTTDPDGCLHPKAVEMTISQDNAFSARVAKILTNIVNKIYDDKPLNDEEIGLLQSTSLPIYKMLNVTASFQKDKAVIDVAGYADVVATDILFQYLHESLNIVRNAIKTLPYPDEILAELTPSLEREMAELRKKQGSAYQQLAQYTQIIEQTQVLERMLAADFSSELASTLSWARGLK